MVLSSDELQILAYLKSWTGKFIPMAEISRRACGRRKFEDQPHWAKGLVTRLVDARLVLVNDRGHYQIVEEAEPQDENYFPGGTTPSAQAEPQTEAAADTENYFPQTPSGVATPEVAGLAQWMSPQIAEILKQARKKNTGQPAG